LSTHYDKEEEEEEQHNLTVFEAGLALLSTIIGGGIAGLPYAIYHAGIPLGVILNVAVASTCLYTGSLYLKVKDLSPTYVESLYELGFVTMGSASIYLISVLIMILGLGGLLIYLMIFGDISASLAQELYGENVENIFTSRTIYVISLGALLLPICLKKKVAEMKCVSIILFLAISIFVLLFMIQLCKKGPMQNDDESFRDYILVTLNMELITSFNIIVFSYVYHHILFPTMNSLGANKSTATTKQASCIAISLALPIYLTFAILSIYTFGSSIEASVLTNVGREHNAFS